MIAPVKRVVASVVTGLHRVQFRFVLLALRAASPFRRLRIATFRADRVGHFISETDLAIQLLKCERDRRTHEVFIFPEKVCNSYLKTLYTKALCELPNVSVLDASTSRLARRLLPSAQQLADVVVTNGLSHWAYCGSPISRGIDRHGLRPSGRPHLIISDEEYSRASRVADRLGIDLGHPYVCLQIRDSQYLADWDRSRDWSYHDYRNPDPHTYVELVRELTTRGIQVVRMGKNVAAAFPFSGQGFVDYATSDWRSDMMDVVLYAKCALAVSGSSSGIEQVGIAFNRPLVVTNLIPFADPRFAVDLHVVIPCLVRHSDSGELLPLSRMMRSRFGKSHQYERAGLEIVRNSPEEIVDAVFETLGRADGTWITQDNDEALQRKFWSWADACGVGEDLPNGTKEYSGHRALLGAAFLKRHEEVLLA